MLNLYNQTIDKYTNMGCIEIGYAHLFLLDYYVRVDFSFFLTLLKTLELAFLWSPKEGGAFGKLYAWNEKAIQDKLGLNIDTKVTDVNGLKEGIAYGLGIIKFNKDVINIFLDGKVDQTEIKDFLKSTKGIGHHLVWKNGYLVDSYTGKAIECSLDILKQLVTKGIIWNTFRYIVPGDKDSILVLHYCKRMGESEKIGSMYLAKFIEINEPVKGSLFKKALDIYFYGRNDKYLYI